jgi:mRNA interferase RelE/StbE
MYKIFLTERALKDLNSLERDTASAILKKLKEYSINPFLYARKLTNPIIGTYRFRIGRYRVIFDTDKDNLVVLRIGHRKNIYK